MQEWTIGGDGGWAMHWGAPYVGEWPRPAGPREDMEDRMGRTGTRVNARLARHAAGAILGVSALRPKP